MAYITQSTTARYGLTIDQRTLNAAAIFGFAIFFVFMLNRVWTYFAMDLSALYMAGVYYHHGAFGMVYDHAPGFFGNHPPSWEPMARQMGIQPEMLVPYVYPPIWAALMAPVTQVVGHQAFFQGAAILMLGLMGAGIVLSHSLCRAFAMPLWLWGAICTALFATSVISLSAIWHLQVQIVVSVMILWAFERYLKGHATSAGVILGFAAALKVAPIAFALVFLLDRNWRALCAALLTSGSVMVLSFLVAGPTLHWEFLENVGAADEGIIFTPLTYTYEMALYALGMWAGLFPWIDGSEAVQRLMTTPAAVSVATKLLMFGALFCAIWRTRALPTDLRIPVQVFLLILVVNLFGPLGWSHYYVPTLMLLPALVGFFPARLGWALIAMVAVVTSTTTVLFIRAHIPGVIPVAVTHVAVLTTLFLAPMFVRPRLCPPSQG